MPPSPPTHPRPWIRGSGGRRAGGKRGHAGCGAAQERSRGGRIKVAGERIRGHGGGGGVTAGSTRVCSPALGASWAARGHGTAAGLEGLLAALCPPAAAPPGSTLRPAAHSRPAAVGAHRHRAAPALRPVGTRSCSLPFLRPFFSSPGPGREVGVSRSADSGRALRHRDSASSPRFLREDAEPPPNRRQRCSKRKEKGGKEATKKQLLCTPLDKPSSCPL